MIGIYALRQASDGEGQRVHRKQWMTGVRVPAVLTALALAAVGCGNSATVPSAEGHSSQVATPDSAASVSFSQLKNVLDLQGMPTGWKAEKQPSGRDVTKNCPKSSTVCAGMTGFASAQYDNVEGTGYVYIELSAYDGRDTARAGYTSRSASFANKDDRQVSMPTVGNASVARTGFNTTSGHPVTSMVMRVGTVVVAMADTHVEQDDSQMLLSLAQTQAERLQQTLRGETPTASLAGR
ncbi:hypothetical protein [Streptomyces sp. WM6378]|uniref:hypothetical protein n=1 Tax=Streptomyces sp. WM6378 TaxID=1415557 RepID=UPI0006AE93E7|nr:hypothetical protein [Streptomyces sp. WM6378]KOU54202.1 hypothetical protein ADK54_02275 [Streptomyces sp. WM6378]